MVLVIQPNIMVVWRWIFECLFEATLPIIVTNSLVQAGVLGIYGLITAAPSEWKLVKGLNHVDGFVEIGWNHHLLDIKAYEKKRDFLRYYPYTLVQLFFLHQELQVSCDSRWKSCGLLSWKFGTLLSAWDVIENLPWLLRYIDMVYIWTAERVYIYIYL